MARAPSKIDPQSDADNAGFDTARREALERLGALAAYTPPAMLTLLLSQRASAQSAAPSPPGPPGPPGPLDPPGPTPP